MACGVDTSAHGAAIAPGQQMRACICSTFEQQQGAARESCLMQVCGGNAGQLLLAASAHRADWDAGEPDITLLPCPSIRIWSSSSAYVCAVLARHWVEDFHAHITAACTAALNRVWNPLLPKVQSGLSADCILWTREQYRTVLRLLLASKHAAVPVSEARRELGRHDDAALEAMIQADLLSHRPPSCECSDLSREGLYCMPRGAHSRPQVEQSLSTRLAAPCSH